MSDDRHCTCPPMERPHPCARKFALSECKAATVMDPICYRWRHQKDEVWKYGHQPQHLVPPRGKEVIGYYIVQPLYTADAIEALQAECERLRAEVAAGDMAFHEEADTVARLRAELAAAQKDTALFQWLADAEPFSARWQIVRLEWWRGRDGWSDVRGDALRSAIKAAMAQEKRDDQ